MQKQSNFQALSVHPLDKEHEVFRPHLEGGYCCPKSDDDMSVVVFAENQLFRILEATDSFASALGFTALELKKGSLRMAFGPETDMSMFKKILGEDTHNDEAVWLYKKNGDELRCSVRSRICNLKSGDTTCTITLVNHETVSSMRTDQQEIKAHPKDPVATNSIPVDSGCSIWSDPALLAHLSAIRRSRRHSKSH